MAKVVEVARLAGVSISTVSHVVNGTRFVSEATRARVVDAIAATGYTPNSVARALRRDTTDSIGLAVSDIGNPYFTDVIRGVEFQARAAGMILLLANSDDDPSRELEAIRALQERRVDGLIISPTAGSRESVFPRLAQLQIPVVLIDRIVEGVTTFDQCGVENEEPTRQLVSHLLGHGHRRIGMIAGIAGISTTDERLSGYRAALEDAGLPYSSDLVVHAGSRADPAVDAVKKLMRVTEPPTALVVGNNLMTIGVLRGLHDIGLAVPRDVALVCYDDFDWADLFQPRLTTIAQPTYAIGCEAVRLLLRRLAHRDAPPRIVRLNPSFVCRESCGCVGRKNRKENV